ncbi:MAG: hypothetical protein ACFC03_03400 [Candidatus Malihini olakiniferum]
MMQIQTTQVDSQSTNMITRILEILVNIRVRYCHRDKVTVLVTHLAAFEKNTPAISGYR